MYQNVHYPVASFAAGPVKSPGVCSIKFFKKEDVLAWPTVDPETGIINSTLSLKPGKLLYFCESISPSRSFTEVPKESNAGPYFEMTVKGSLSGSYGAHLLTAGTMIHHEWGLIVTDKNGVTRLIGSENAGASFIMDYTSGQGTDSRRTELTWKWQHSQPAPVYTANSFDIIIGGVTISAGSLTLLLRFEVGAAGAPMVHNDTILVNSGFVNKRLLIMADGIGIPVDDFTGAIDWSTSIQRHAEKALASNTIEFIGGVIDKEIIEIYAFS